jgi:hypothetical protein
MICPGEKNKLQNKNERGVNSVAGSMNKPKAKVMKRVFGVTLALGLQMLSTGMLGAEQPHSFLPGFGKAEAATVVDVRTFGAKGNGATNDTAAIQKAINSLPSTGGTVVIPTGVYGIDAVTSLKLRSNVTIQMTPSTILGVIPNAAAHYEVLHIGGVSNVNVNSGVLWGDRLTHKATTGEHGFGAAILGSSNVTVTGTASNNMWGDGFYVGNGPTFGSSLKTRSTNVKLIDVTADNNRRQGISVTSGKDISIVRAKLTNTNGAAPSAGIDVEPNGKTDILQNISIVDTYTANNQGAGISLSLGAILGTTTPISITVTNHTDNGSKQGMNISGGSGIIPGTVRVDNPTWMNSKTNALAVVGTDYRGFSTTVNNAKVVNANTSAKGAAISVYNYNTAVQLGNVAINNANISDTRTTKMTVAAFYAGTTVSSKPMKNVTIVKPILNGIKLGNVTTAKVTY